MTGVRGWVEKMESAATRHNMSDERFEELVLDAEKVYAASPGAYKTRIALLAVLGYAFISLFLILFIVGAWFVGYEIYSGQIRINKLTLGLLVTFLFLGFVVVKALWVKLPDPEGVVLREEEAPVLFAELKNLQQKQKVRIDEVLIDENLNACVVQQPRLGLFGWHKNYLVIGLPLLYGNTVDQAIATLAHEMGHISGSHGKFGAWIYGLQKTWSTLLGELREGAPYMYFVFFPFFVWYMPYFAAFSMVLKRQQEYEADRMATDLSNPEANAASLILLELQGRYLGSVFWKKISDSVHTTKEPPDDVYVQLAKAIQHIEMPEEQAQKWYQERLNFSTDIQDSHPSLVDRLADIGYPSKNPDEIKRIKISLSDMLQIKQNAADQLLGAKAQLLAQDFSTKWATDLRDGWLEQHEASSEDRIELEKLQAKEEPLSKDDLLSIAVLTETFYGVESALPVYQRAVQEHPHDADAVWLLGNVLLREEKEDALQHIEHAMTLSSRYVETGCLVAKDYHMRRGETDKVEEFRKRIAQYNDEVFLGREERSELRDGDFFNPHELDEITVQGLVDWLAGLPQVKSAYLVQKEVKYLADCKQYILAVKTGLFGPTSTDKHAELMDALQQGLEEYPLSVFPVILDSCNKTLVSRITSADQADIYSRETVKR